MMPKRWSLYPVVFLLLFIASDKIFAQRTYANSSILATGNWFKLGVTNTGVYRLDIPFLQSLGINVQSIPTGSIRIFGNGGAMLPESNSIRVVDDLLENAIKVVDGGDGVLNGSDYILFYSPGPHQWLADLPNRTFHHQYNLYSDTAYYYITVGGQGKRIQLETQSLQPTFSITSYTDRYVHELDTFNFLSSGKQWFGEEFCPGTRESAYAFIPNSYFPGNCRKQYNTFQSCFKIFRRAFRIRSFRW